jgi:hypothetical protein
MAGNRFMFAQMGRSCDVRIIAIMEKLRIERRLDEPTRDQGG